MSRLRSSTIAAGVPAGAQTPSQPERMKLIPASASVGTSGNKTLRAADANDFELPVAVLRDEGQWRRGVEVDPTGDDLLHRLRTAAKWHLVHRDPGGLLQLPRQNLLSRAEADRTVVHLASMRFGVGDEGTDVGGRNRIRQRQPIIIFGDQGNGRQIAEPGSL